MTATSRAAATAATTPDHPDFKQYAFNEKRPRSEIMWPTLLTLIGLHIGALFAVGWIIWLAHRGVLINAKVWWTSLAMLVIPGYGISLGYHRYFTHDGYKTSRTFEAILLSAAAFTLEGPAYNWVKDHWWHHDRSDCVGDLHSPYQYSGPKGPAWGHVGWIYYEHYRPAVYDGNRAWIEDDQLIRWQRRYYWVFLVATFAIPAAICGWEGLLVAGFLRIVVFQNITWGINSICHRWGTEVKGVSYRWKPGGQPRTRNKSDGSRHFVPWDLPSLGESNHDRHHLFAKVAFHGWEWYALDPTKWLLKILELLHIVWDVERPPKAVKCLKIEADLPEDSLITAHRLHRLLPAA